MKKLSDKILEEYKSKLLALRSRLRGDVSSMKKAVTKKNEMGESSSTSSVPLHMADVGTDNFEQEFTFSLMQVGSVRLSEVEDALQRIEEGTYGICESCKTRIPKARLDAIPYASLCIKCATLQGSSPRARWTD